MPDADARGRPVPRRVPGPVGAWAATALVVFVAMGAAVFGVDAAATRNEDMPLVQPWATLAEVSAVMGALGALTVPFVLVLRRRAPQKVTFWLIGLAFLTPLTPVPSAIALVTLVRRHPGPVAWRALGLQAVLVLWFCLWDLRGDTVATSALRAFIAPPESAPSAEVPVSAAQVVVVVLVMVLAPVLLGFYLRGREQLGESQLQVQRAEEATGSLSAQLTRQAERELIAREVHDVIGHRLSLLSLHAGGLEVAAGGDERLARSASLVRQSAQETMHDLRSLVAVLREPGHRAAMVGTELAPTSLADLTRVIEDTVSSGAPIVSSVYLSHAEDADPVLAGAVYRIVQELLTNARKHAQDTPVRLSVRGGPGDGVTIETANAADAAHVRPPGNGLLGVRERAEILGGSLQAGPDGQGAFRACVSLPWLPAPS